MIKKYLNVFPYSLSYISENSDYVIHLMEGLGHGGGDRKQMLALYEKLINFLKRVIS